jgi:hypothetical protein
MQTKEMRRAMNTLKAFSEKEHAYHAYQARQNYLREQQSIQLEFDDLRAEVEQARAAVERERAVAVQERAAAEQARATVEHERAAKEEALAENERLKRLLADKAEPSGPGRGSDLGPSSPPCSSASPVVGCYPRSGSYTVTPENLGGS